jgi:hypothetical protein
VRKENGTVTATAISNINLSNYLEAGISKSRLWSGRVLSTLAIVFMAMDGGMKLFKPAFVVQATIQLGAPLAMRNPRLEKILFHS